MKNELVPYIDIESTVEPVPYTMTRQKVGIICGLVTALVIFIFALLPRPEAVAMLPDFPQVGGEVSAFSGSDIYLMSDSGTSEPDLYRSVRIIEDKGAYIVYLDIAAHTLRQAYVHEIQIAGLANDFTNSN